MRGSDRGKAEAAPHPAHGAISILGRPAAYGPDGDVELPEELLACAAVLALGGAEPVNPAQLAAALPNAATACPDVVEHDLRALARILASAGLPDAVECGTTGYRLRLRSDVQDFERDVRAAGGRLAVGDRAGAVALFDAALGRWRAPLADPPLTGLEVHGWAAGQVARLREQRLTAFEDRWESALRLAAAAVSAAGAPVAGPSAVAVERSASGSAARAAAEVGGAVRAHPLRERLWELLLVAHFLAGRRGDALAEYGRAERVFAEQLGMAPGERLRAVADAVRAGDVGDGTGPFGAPTAPPRATIPPAVRAPLPVPLTPLVDRKQLLGRLADELRVHRLVTLTGPGGCGKTRLAIAVASGAPGPRAWFVDLSAVDSPVQVPAAVAAAFGVDNGAGRDPVQAITELIGTTERLVVLDNCEQVLAGCAELVRRLLPACLGLRVLATSRARLGLPGEAYVTVPPLSVPAPRLGAYRIAELREVPAARLFLDRAAARLGHPVPEREASAVATLCTELDGMPLALELAAARTPLLSVTELVERLRADLGLLRSTDPTVPARHRTLTAAVASSVRQLSSDAAELFERLAVFSGAFATAAAAAVHKRGADLLPELAGASLIIPAEPDAGPDPPARWRMLSTVRRCAQAMLAESGGEVAARRAHAGYYIGLAERAEEHLHGQDHEHWLTTLRAEWANLRAALGWLAEAGAAGIPYGDLRLATAVATYCHLWGHYRDGRTWLAAALDRHPDAPAALRARATTGAALLAMLLCDYPAAAEHARAARDAWSAAGDGSGAARVELIQASIAREEARYADAAAHCRAAGTLYAEGGDERGEARAVQLSGFAAWLAGDFDRAEPRLHACLRRFELLGDAEAAADAVVHLGAVAHYRGEPDRARALLDAALERYAALGFPEGVAWAHNLRGLVDLRAGRVDRAAAHLTHSLVVHRKVGDRWRTASVLEALAEVARLQGAPRRAAGLLGHAAQIRAAIGAPVPACERPAVAATEAALRATLGADAFRAVAVAA